MIKVSAKHLLSYSLEVYLILNGGDMRPLTTPDFLIFDDRLKEVLCDNLVTKSFK